MCIMIKKADKNDIIDYYKIIKDRCMWFEKNNIDQWDKDYPIRFNISYFNNCLKEDDVFIAIKNDEIVGGMVIRNKDVYYGQVGNSYYIHHLVSKVGTKKVGSELVDFAIEYSKRNNKRYLRLDAISSNKVLNDFYKEKGFYKKAKKEKNNKLYNLYERVI